MKIIITATIAHPNGAVTAPIYVTPGYALVGTKKEAIDVTLAQAKQQAPDMVCHTTALEISDEVILRVAEIIKSDRQISAQNYFLLKELNQ